MDLNVIAKVNQLSFHLKTLREFEYDEKKLNSQN